jgi:hypothetical protein
MKLSLLRYSAWISLVLLAAVSCRSSRVYFSGEQADRISQSIFTGTFEKMTFKAKVIYQEKELAGLWLIKNAPDGNYKIAFYNELGMTYLEGTLDCSSKHKKLTVNNIAPFLNNNLFVKNFEKSLQMVFSEKENPHLPASPPPSFPASLPPDKNESLIVVQLRNGFRLELAPRD